MRDCYQLKLHPQKAQVTKFNATIVIRWDMKKKTAGTKESHNATNAKNMGIWQRIVDFRMMKKGWHN